MNNNHTKKLIKIENLDNNKLEDKLHELHLEEVSSILGGLSFAWPLTDEEYLAAIESLPPRLAQMYGYTPEVISQMRENLNQSQPI